MKKQIKTMPLIYPIPIVLVGAYVNGQANYVNVGDVAVMGINPPLLVISLNEKHHTTQGIVESQKFSVNMPTASMVKQVDYCGIYSGKDVDKSTLFTNLEGTSGVPIIDECPVNLECKVIEEVQVKQRHMFIAEVVQTHISEEYIIQEGETQRIADLETLNPIAYAMDNRYYGIGEKMGIGYREGKDYTPE